MGKIAILGFGVVGSGTAELIAKNKELIKNKTGVDLDVGHILEINDMSDTPYADRQTKDINVILNDPDVTVVAETMGGVTHAYDFVLACLKCGKSVVTSNKELVAKKGAELIKTAYDNNCRLLFEASTGGAIPIMNVLQNSLSANDITGVAGILNGTTNFILTKMLCENMEFKSALELATKLGYAEKDPTDDIEGFDACRKVCILSSLIFGKHVYPDTVYCEGITKITKEDAEYAENAGYSIKLIGSVKRMENGKILPMVRPAFICKGSPLYGINDVYNGIIVYGDALGEAMFYGKGAGKMPTASAVVSDIIEAFRTSLKQYPLLWNDSENADHIFDYKDDVLRFYLRVKNVSANVLGDVEMLSRNAQSNTEIAFITSAMTEHELCKKIEPFKSDIINIIRVFDD